MTLPSTMPELSALDLFLSVVRTGSLSKAATAHHITQPSASSRIRNLEATLGLALLERSPTGSVPTREGSLVAGWAEGIVQAAEELGAGVAALRARQSGRLRLTASFTIAEYLLPAWLEAFLRTRPDDSVELEVANSTSVLQSLAVGTTDLGFIETPLDTPALRQQVVATDELVVVVGRTHQWAKRSQVPLEALATTPLVLREVGSGTREAFEEALRRTGHDAPIAALELGSTSAVRALVLTGGSPSVISRLAVRSDLDAGTLAAVLVPGLEIHRQLRAVWPRSTTLPPLAAALLNQLPNL